VKPGVNINTLMSTVNEDIKPLTYSDTIVVLGGMEDVSKNNAYDGLQHLSNFVKSNTHTNIILTTVPHRHDIPDWSCVNSEVKTFNRKLIKLMKPHKHVFVVEIDLDRKPSTKHGMHMRNSGKEKLAEKLANVITNIFLKHEQKISLCWKFDNGNEDIESVSSTEVNKADTSELVNADS